MKSEINPHEVSPEQIAEWKAKHKCKNVFRIQAKDQDGNVKVCWLRTPSRNVLDLAYTSGKKNISKFNEAIINNCWLAGDEEIKTDDFLFGGVSGQLDEVITFAEAEVKKY